MTEMKKHYITPAMEVVNIETQAMLASSIEKIGATKSEMGWGSEENANSSRGTWGNLWD